MIAVIGGGVAGFSVCLGLRAAGFDGQITLISPEEPYDLPPLSTDFLTGEVNDIRLGISGWEKEFDIDFRRCQVRAIGEDLSVYAGEVLHPEYIVLATGARARRLDGALTLHTRADAEIIRQQLHPHTSVAVIGSGLLAAELVSSARICGATATLYTDEHNADERIFGPILGAKLNQQHLDNGVEVVHQRKESAQADIVLAAVGASANTRLVDSLVTTDSGVVVDEGRRSSNPRIFAVGDVVAGSVHWHQAQQDAAAAVATLTGTDFSPEPAWIYSDRYGGTTQSLGIRSAGEMIQRGDACFQLTDKGTLGWVAAMNDTKTIQAARRIMSRAKILDPAQLADPTVSLKSLAK